MKTARRASVLATLLVAALGLEAASAAGTISVKREATASPDSAALVVTCSQKGAEVYLNRALAGKAPYSSGSLEPGQYLVEVAAAGFGRIGRFVLLEGGYRYTMRFELPPLVGYLAFDLEPSDAEVSVDGERVYLPKLELPVGEHEVLARRFGYVERRATVELAADETRILRLELEPAAFAVEFAAPARAAFNPANPGVLGLAILPFSVTSYGSARIEVRDASGGLVAFRDYPSLETWRQEFSWDGKGLDGSPCPDGSYSLGLDASPAPGTGGEAAALRRELTIDSSLVIGASGSIAAAPGALLFPDPRIQAAGSVALELAWLARADELAASAFALGASASLGGRAALGFGAAVETEGAEADTSAADLALSLDLPLLERGPLALAAFARGAWSSAASPVLPGAGTGAELSIPASLSLGVARLGLAPGIGARLEDGDWEAELLARAGACLELPILRAGLSAELGFGLASGGLEPNWPALACAEARLILEPSPLVAAAYLLASFEPGQAPALGLGFGLGLGFVF